MEAIDFYATIAAIQAELKAPKDLDNKFGGYRYRSAENILAAVKPLLAKYKLAINLTDTIAQIGDRFYLHAVATVTDGANSVGAEAWAREPLAKKGMDESQVTGSASSYARKYALCGLLGIDDSSADPDNPVNHPDNPDTAKRDARIRAAAERGAAQAKADKAKAAEAAQKNQGAAKTATTAQPAQKPKAPIVTDAQLKAEVKACETTEALKAVWDKYESSLLPAQKAIFTDRKNAILNKAAEKEIEAVL